jgi:catechol 2,3-dioxygenase-like lactoylglutathione lyase family enzyme
VPTITEVLETSLYVKDLDRAEAFYRSLFRFERLLRDDRMAALRVCPTQVLLLFKQGGTHHPVPMFNGFIPPHDGSGPVHLALGISATDIAFWLERLVAQQVDIESHLIAPNGCHSIYFRDPDGHLIELTEPRIWEMAKL